MHQTSWAVECASRHNKNKHILPVKNSNISIFAPREARCSWCTKEAKCFYIQGWRDDLFFSFWFHLIIAYINYLSKLSCILIFYQKRAIFCCNWFSTKSLHVKAYWGGNGGTVLSPKLLPVLSKGRESEDEPEAWKPSKSIHLLSSTFEDKFMPESSFAGMLFLNLNHLRNSTI